MDLPQISSKESLSIVDREIIPIYQVTDAGEKVVDGRELYEFLGVESRFSDWIRNKIDQYDFKKDLDFNEILSKSTGGRPKKEYILSLSMGKDLGMVENNEEGKIIREYFKEMEEQAKKFALDVPETRAEALRLAAYLEEIRNLKNTKES